jgi:hypothetical protein
MDESGCTAEFHDDELKRFLDPGTLELIARFRQEKAVDLADIEGLEVCDTDSPPRLGAGY